MLKLIPDILKQILLKRLVLLISAFTLLEVLALKVLTVDFIIEFHRRRILRDLMRIILEMSLVGLDTQLIKKTIQV